MPACHTKIERADEVYRITLHVGLDALQLADADDPNLEGHVLTGYRYHHLRCDGEVLPSLKTDHKLRNLSQR